ncbi:phosphodiester glycosidase family protein [Qipengyuania sp. S6317L1]|uniref:phosphodiester glycosidase family protein n=1 Tax=Qipengyuania sp. S6317L1 TaxID=2926410 RepID=UPI001FF60420|nr:phosphodiester glycosidase family protein [Qipengyuania sp. S6317L1]MCK0099503.1 phosphodiester glycosidase family protein [Qipengyuania sp. S6317L1]
MKHLSLIFAATLALTACEQQPSGEPVVRSEIGDAVPRPIQDPVETLASEENEDAVCRSVTFESVPLTHCTADPETHRINTGLAPSSGPNFGTIEGWAAGRDESRIAFVMNGGMYDDALKPVGYFVRDEDRLGELDRGDGSGNFYLKPNGVFFGTGGRWQILASDTFLRTIGTRPQFGTQSGPMLVIDGKLHPEIQDNGPSKAIRNGVGVDAEGKAHFVISDAPLSFGQLARYFRDEVKTPNALFLDGNISSLWHPASGRMDKRRVGPVIVVERRDGQ